MFGQQREEKKECGLKSRILTKIAKHHHWLFFFFLLLHLILVTFGSTWSGKTDPESLTRAEVTCTILRSNP